MKPNKDTNKLVEISFKILLSNTGMSMQIYISQISGILLPVLGPVLSNTFHYFMYSRPKHAQMPTPWRFDFSHIFVLTKFFQFTIFLMHLPLNIV